MNVYRLATLAVALLCATSCKTPEASKPAPLAAEVPVDSPTQWLLWTRDDAASTTTLVDADGQTLAVADGIWLGSEKGLWRHAQVGLPVEQADCDCEMRAMEKGVEVPASCKKAALLEVAALEPLGEGSALHIPTSEYLQNDARSVYATIDGNVGPFVFATSCIEEYTCGSAHGGTTCNQWIWDLRTLEPVEIYAMSAEPLRGEEMLRFVREGFEDEQEAAELQSEDLQFTWVGPLYEGAFTPRMEEQYTAPTCYACSDGAWDSYTTSTRRTVEVLPAALADWLAKHPAPAGAAPQELAGWSMMPSDASMRAQFMAAARR